MQTTCPCCFCSFPIEAGLNDRHARRVADAIAKVPGGLAEQVLRYAGLFRRPDSLLDWSQAVNIITRISRMIEEGEIHRAGMRIPAPPKIWREAVEEMLGRRDALDLPLTSDGYLKKVVREKASQRLEEQKERTARNRPTVSRDTCAVENGEEEERPKGINKPGLQRLTTLMRTGKDPEADKE